MQVFSNDKAPAEICAMEALSSVYPGEAETSSIHLPSAIAMSVLKTRTPEIQRDRKIALTRRDPVGKSVFKVSLCSIAKLADGIIVTYLCIHIKTALDDGRAVKILIAIRVEHVTDGGSVY